ncbi:BRCA1-associated protein 2-domain-containing protein [Tricladium varicosporioides]|nr:BRCA1-associated protein 2-domain-containing protein [Hymenoscyphus varicosporioides]
MPSYYYHLKFELYPAPPTVFPTTNQKKEVWVPPETSDIFDSKGWPSHSVLETQRQEDLPTREREQERRGDKKSNKGLVQGQDILSGNTGGGKGVGVIDCGTSRGTSRRSNGSDHSTIPVHTILEFPPPVPDLVKRDIQIARKDWRFGPVRVEGFDMGPTHEQRMERTRGESSGSALALGIDGHNAGGINTRLGEGGRVTKARYEVVEGKNTEVGWGIVHLYRDGEESSGLGNSHLGSGTETHHTNTEGAHFPSTGGSSEPKDKQADRIGNGEDCTTLCIPAVPSYLTPSDFLGFVGEKTRTMVSHFRMVMTGKMNRYLVLMKFRDGNEAIKWRQEWDGKVFNSMEPETCHVTFIKSITFQTPASARPNTSFPELSHDPFTPSSPVATFLKPFPPPTPNLVELPTCPVCLERMDDTAGLLTILCQHVFHCDCLQKWKGTGCPVCRHANPSLSISSGQNNSSTYPSYDPSNPPFGSGEASLCSICDCTDDLWICLICGNVGCGRYKGGHAKDHWKEHAHNFALEIETQHVWDYAGDMWVHRLIRDKGDSKVIELPSSRHGHAGGQEGMDMVPREKLESIGMEYTHLLTSQLESQRVYFEELVGKAVAKASAASQTAQNATSKADEALSKLATLELENKMLKNETIPGLEKDLAREKKKAERSAEVARGFGKSLMEEKKVSEGLMERIEHVNKGMMEISVQLTKVKEENEDLKEQNRDLLFSITAGEKLKGMEGEEGGLEAGELEGGSVSLPPEKEKKRGKGKGRGK